MVDAVEHLHQLITVCSGLYVIKKIQLRDAGRGEIVQHDAGFGIAMAGDPNPVQRSDCSSNNVPGVPRGSHQFRGLRSNGTETYDNGINMLYLKCFYLGLTLSGTKTYVKV